MNDHSPRLDDALSALRAGRPVLVRDDPGGGGTVMLAAGLATPAWVAWTVRRSSGLLCVPLPGDRADSLDLPQMVRSGRDDRGAAYTVSVDAARGISTGISATDRAHTARVLAAPETSPADLTRPGHLLPLRVRPGGVLEASRPAEASVDLCRLAGLPPVALIADLISEDSDGGWGAPEGGDLGEGPDGVAVVATDAIARHRLFHGDGATPRVVPAGRTSVSTVHGRLTAVGFHDTVTGAEHVALLGEAAPGSYPLVAVHAECLVGHVIGALDCSCGARLHRALGLIAEHGGALVYLRRTAAPVQLCDPAGRGPVLDTADHAAAAAILTELGLTRVRLDGDVVAPGDLAPGGITAVAVTAHSSSVSETGRAG